MVAFLFLSPGWNALGIRWFNRYKSWFLILNSQWYKECGGGRETLKKSHKIPEPRCLVSKVGLVITYMPICKHLNHILMSLLGVKSSISSVTSLYPTLYDPMDCSMPGFPVHHQLLELTQIHVHRVCNAIQPSHPLSSPSPPAFNLSQHQGLL